MRYLRPLGIVEHAMTRLEADAAAGHTVRVVTLHGCIDLLQLNRAWRTILSVHPLLRSARARLDGSLWFVEAEYDEPIEERHSESLDDALKRELEEPFVQGRTARLRVYRSANEQTAHVVVAAHHAVVDGASMTRVVRELFEFYANHDSHSPAELLPPPVEDVLPPRYRVGSTEALRMLALEHQAQEPVAAADPHRREVKVATIPLTRSSLGRLRDRSRILGVSLTATVGAHILDTLGSPRAFRDRGLPVAVTTDLRPHLVPAVVRGCVAAYMSGLRIVVPSTLSSGEAAQRIEALRRESEQRGTPLLGVYAQEIAVELMISGALPAPAVTVSNVGDCGLAPKYGELRVTNVAGAVPMHRLSHGVYAHLVSWATGACVTVVSARSSVASGLAARLQLS